MMCFRILSAAALIMLVVTGCSDRPSDIEQSRGALEAPASSLNLDISAVVDDEASRSQALQDDPKLLPDLFESEEKKSRISGKPLLEYSEDSLQPQVQGAEIKVEIQTQ